MSLSKLKPDTLITRRADLLASKVGEETVMLDMASGFYFGLDSIGTDIWQIIEQPTTVQAICDKLLAEYDVSEEQCRTETLIFLEDLLKNKMIEAQ